MKEVSQVVEFNIGAVTQPLKIGLEEIEKELRRWRKAKQIEKFQREENTK